MLIIPSFTKIGQLVSIILAFVVKCRTHRQTRFRLR